MARPSRDPFSNIFQDSSISDPKLHPVAHITVTTSLDVQMKMQAIPCKAAVTHLSECHSKSVSVNHSN